MPVWERSEFYDAIAEELDPPYKSRGAGMEGEGQCEDEGEAGGEAAEEGADGV